MTTINHKGTTVTKVMTVTNQPTYGQTDIVSLKRKLRLQNQIASENKRTTLTDRDRQTNRQTEKTQTDTHKSSHRQTSRQ